MYDQSDPRAALPTSGTGPALPSGGYAPPSYVKFYERPPEDEDAQGQSWYARGQNFVVVYTLARDGARFERSGQKDEYVLILPDSGTAARVTANGEEQDCAGEAVVFVPPGDSSIEIRGGGRIVRLFTALSEDLVARCPNNGAYAAPNPLIPPFKPWPAPPGGYRIRRYGLDVQVEPGRFGRIFRGSTFMVNYLDPRHEPRDITKLSPHHHDDFEQCSLALDGEFIHDLRWPWTPNMNHWREDEHEFCASPSVAVIPPPSIHTTRAQLHGLNQLVDIFCPPRMDFSRKPGWVLNADDYPMPDGA
ncbi:hypothetical protein SAMN02745194_02066 [Roseomonas rosea]|uniref:Uncharacterized protein n=1 Tax=Muricoccus roseus TaxID=198092 RepID=A0A1M6HN44_9PROT|nr:hypothetical protein [Roseomonas rosea]SHJ23580.1 hypothetical protein SAMN02745194_02066 [Roseomonas rosea]